MVSAVIEIRSAGLESSDTISELADAIFKTLAAGEDLVNSGAELIHRVNEVVYGAELGGVKIGKDFIGRESVGSAKFKVSGIGF